jgi:hypothetical protein
MELLISHFCAYLLVQSEIDFNKNVVHFFQKLYNNFLETLCNLKSKLWFNFKENVESLFISQKV